MGVCYTVFVSIIFVNAAVISNFGVILTGPVLYDGKLYLKFNGSQE